MASAEMETYRVIIIPNQKGKQDQLGIIKAICFMSTNIDRTIDINVVSILFDVGAKKC